MSAIVSYPEITIQIIAIAGALYWLINIFKNWLLPDIIRSKEKEESNSIKMLLEDSSLSQKQSEQKEIVANSRVKILEIEAKVKKWIVCIKSETQNTSQRLYNNEQIAAKRHKIISNNLTSHIQAGWLIEEIKSKVTKDIVKSSVNSKNINTASCSDLKNNFSIAYGSCSRLSFTYAKVFLGYLKKHNEPLPDTELLISLSKLFKSNDFFFFAKGGLLEKPSETDKSDSCKICVFTCKKIKVANEKGCCICCYQWPEMLEKIKIDKNLQRFLEVIIAKNRQKIISAVLKELAFLIHSQNGQILCEVESTEELSAQQINELRNKIMEDYKLEPVFIFKINPCLIGGVLVKSNLFRIDNSTYGRLSKIFYKLDTVKECKSYVWPDKGI